MRNLQCLIEAIGTNLYQFDLAGVLEVIHKSIKHLNRFVREIAYFVINAIFVTSKGVLDTDHKPKFLEYCEEFVPLMTQGLADNWSQVRYASCLCARSFYDVIQNDQEVQDKYNANLVPRMCLNRYYVAAGVRIYSNETWQIVFGGSGKQIVCKYAAEVSAYYIS